MPAVLGLVHPVANPFIKDQAFPSSCSADHTVGIFRRDPHDLRRDPHDLRTAAAAPDLTYSHAIAEKPDEITFLFGLFNSPKPSFPEVSQQTSSPVSLVRFVSHLSHSMSRIWEWHGRAFLTWLKAGIRVGISVSRLACSYGWPFGAGSL